jgi:hypothetical protein
MQMTYTLSESQKATLTLQGRKAANRQLWAAEKADRAALKAYTDKKERKPKKVAKRADKLKAAAIEAVYASVSQTHSRGEALLPTKPLDSKVESVTAKRLKRKARKGPKDSNGKLEAQAQRHSMQMAQTRAAKTAPKVDVVYDEANDRRVEVERPEVRKAKAITQTWMDFNEIVAETGLSDDMDIFRYATLQEGYGCPSDEVSMDDCL